LKADIPIPNQNRFIIRPDFTFVLLGLFMIVEHRRWMDDKTFLGKTEGNPNDIGPFFRYLNQGLQEFEIRNLMVIRMISSALHLLFKCILYYFYFACPTDQVTDRESARNTCLLHIQQRFPYNLFTCSLYGRVHRYWMFLKCLDKLHQWVFYIKTRKRVYLNMYRKWVFLFF
jgi:hypothetical protein